jgi:hypothetical protein
VDVSHRAAFEGQLMRVRSPASEGEPSRVGEEVVFWDSIAARADWAAHHIT